MSDMEQGIAALGILVAWGGGQVLDEDAELLKQSADALSPTAEARVSEIAEAIMSGFFAAATDGYEFVPQSRIRERFGRTLRENYPEAGDDFMRFAISYWTLKLLANDLWDHRHTVAAGLLATLESQIASLFFPTPGPISIDWHHREAAQRQFLRQFAPRINADRFVAGNPILLRDARASRSGCGAMLLIVGLGLAAGLLTSMT